MLKRPHYIALGLIVVLTLLISNLPARTTGRLKASIGSVFLPLFGLAGSSHQLADRAETALTTRTELLKENEALKLENQELRLKLGRTEELERENAKFRQLYGWQQQTRIKAKLARVVGFDPANWWNSLQIDIGQRDGVRENMAVLSADGFLAGRVSLAGLTRSQVVLLGDPNCKVPALVENETREQGVIAPDPRVPGRSFVKLIYLSSNANLKPGQNVVTSGYSAIYPKNILIGKIVDSSQADDGLSIEARVKLAANLNALEEVWILTSP
jgi:rod shape-determining protein MreC